MFSVTPVGILLLISGIGFFSCSANLFCLRPHLKAHRFGNRRNSLPLCSCRIISGIMSFPPIARSSVRQPNSQAFGKSSIRVFLGSLRIRMCNMHHSGKRNLKQAKKWLFWLMKQVGQTKRKFALRKPGNSIPTLALMAVVRAANSFILSTHQVKALLMSSGGYRNTDYFQPAAG